MSRAFFGLFFAVSLFSESSFWNYSYSYTLKKDQVARIVIKKDYLPTIEKEGILEFRWTLYKADKLVLLVNYEGFPTQHLIFFLFLPFLQNIFLRPIKLTVKISL